MKRGLGGNADASDPDAATVPESDPLLTCEFQDGTISVYEDRIHIERSSRSKFEDKWIALNQIQDVVYADRWVIKYLQIDQLDHENDTEGWLTTPVDENTLHFGRGKRSCARDVRDTIWNLMTEQ